MDMIVLFNRLYHLRCAINPGVLKAAKMRKVVGAKLTVNKRAFSQNTL